MIAPSGCSASTIGGESRSLTPLMSSEYSSRISGSCPSTVGHCPESNCASEQNLCSALQRTHKRCRTSRLKALEAVGAAALPTMAKTAEQLVERSKAQRKRALREQALASAIEATEISPSSADAWWEVVLNTRDLHGPKGGPPSAPTHDTARTGLCVRLDTPWADAESR